MTHLYKMPKTVFPCPGTVRLFLESPKYVPSASSNSTSMQNVAPFIGVRVFGFNCKRQISDFHCDSLQASGFRFGSLPKPVPSQSSLHYDSAQAPLRTSVTFKTPTYLCAVVA